MKRLICLIVSVVVMFLNVLSISAEVLGGGTNNPVTRDEVEIGTIIGFDEEDGDFGTTVYYLKLQDNSGREATYPLADKTYLNYDLIKAKTVYETLKEGYSSIAYVVRDEKIKYINPYILNYEENKSISVNKGRSEEISVTIYGVGENTNVKWSSDSRIIFEFIETSGEYNETVKIKGRIVGEATLTAELYIDDEVKDSLNFTIKVAGSVISSDTNSPVSPEEIQRGTILNFDSEEGAFDETIYYVNIKTKNEEEAKFALAKNVIFTKGVYTASDAAWILQNSESNITFVVRGGKIEYINPYMPDGIFESAEIEDCYKWKDKIYGHISFEYLVGECKCLVAAYDEQDILCSVTSFDVSYKDAYSYDFEISDSNGAYIKVFFIKSKQSIKPMEEHLSAVVE